MKSLTINRVSSPVAPLTLQEAKTHLRLTTGDEDTLVQTIIESAWGWVERSTGRALTRTTYEARWDQFPFLKPAQLEYGSAAATWFQGAGPTGVLELPRSPAFALLDVSYVDEDYNVQEIDVDTLQFEPGSPRIPGRVCPKIGQTWPAIIEKPGAVRVTFSAGPVAAEALAKSAMFMVIGHLYENREAVITGTIVAETVKGLKSLLSLLKVYDAG